MEEMIGMTDNQKAVIIKKLEKWNTYLKNLQKGEKDSLLLEHVQMELADCSEALNIINTNSTQISRRRASRCIDAPAQNILLILKAEL